MIQYGVSNLSVVPVRKESNERSEMTTQLLFGETYQIVEEGPKWSYIKISFDHYEGWIDRKTIQFITEDIFSQINSHSVISTHQLSTTILCQNEKIILPAGCSLPNYHKETKTFTIDKTQYQLSDIYTDDIPDIITLSKQFLNSPYLWGGKNPFGIDCSGFVQVIYKIMGVKLPRDANQQVKEGSTVNFISDAKPGDLAFFDNSEGIITHVGLLLNYNEIIHSSGKVRIDKLDQQGIYNSELKKYTHQLRIIKRIL